MAKQTVIQQLVEKQDFPNLVRLYGDISKVRDDFAQAAKNVPHHALDGTVKGLDGVLDQVRDGLSKVSGREWTDGEIRTIYDNPNPFGAAPSTSTEQFASAQQQAQEVQVVMGEASQVPPDAASEIDPVRVVRQPGQALFGDNTTHALREGLRPQDVDAIQNLPNDALAAYPNAQWLNDLLRREPSPSGVSPRIVLTLSPNHWLPRLIGVAILAAAIGVSACGLLVLIDNGGKDKSNVTSGATATTSATASLTPGLIFPWLNDPGWPEETGLDLGPELGVTYDRRDGTVIQDPTGDQFTAFGGAAIATSPHAELLAGGGAIVAFDASSTHGLQCGLRWERGATVYCPAGVTGEPRAGNYFVGIMTFSGALSERDAAHDFSYELYFRSEGTAAQTPRGDLPYYTLQNTNRYARLLSSGLGDWTLDAGWLDGLQFQPPSQVAAASGYEPDFRAVVGEHSVAFMFPEGFCSPGCSYNMGTYVRPTGAQPSADTIAQDVLRHDPTEQLYSPANFTGLARMPSWVTDYKQMIVRDVIGAYTVANRSANGVYLYEHLDQSAKDYWGADVCETHFTTDLLPDPTFKIDVHNILGPAEWLWQFGGRDIATISDVYTADVTITQHDQVRDGQAHYKWDPTKNQLGHFSPCGP